MKKKETLGQVLKQRRGAYAYTQRELAKKLGVKASHIAYLENGRRRPSLSLLSRISDTLELDKKRLFLLASGSTVDHRRARRDLAQQAARGRMAEVCGRSRDAGASQGDGSRTQGPEKREHARTRVGA